MREVNFSIPSANKASVGITTALYDRRALDCTSTLPLINSLNHLAYLTTSSARIRDILTVDGGVERLVNIIKDGRSKDLMEMWKWNLAFQCVVNIGVRGSEAVRTRVVEADMVPVIATILDNYIKIVDKCREKAEAEFKRTSAQMGSSGRHRHRSGDMLGSSNGHRAERGRRHPPPPIDIPAGSNQNNTEFQPAATAPLPGFSFSSPPERTTFRRPQHHSTRSREGRPPLFTAASTAGRQQGAQSFGGAVSPGGDGPEFFGIRPVRDADRLPSMLPTLQAEIISQPQSPMTPSGTLPGRPVSPRRPAEATRPRRRTSHGPQIATGGDSDDGQQEEMVSDASADPAPAPEPIVGLQNDINMPDMVDNEGMLDDGAPVGLNAPASDGTEVETFNITHRSTIDGSIVTPIPPPAPGPITLSPIVPAATVETAAPPIPANANLLPRYVQERNPGLSILPAMPRDEDALMSLQLLAYVSKYCNLRSFFQQSHLVPKLKIGSDLQLLDGEMPKRDQQMEMDSDDEFLLPNNFNIFPLVEKFTVRHHSQDMQYWAGVVMRNLCRKDDSRGGIRQCAYYQCGRWEEYTRQFAKCRRCRRTKYCSKECQKSAWVYHRHWCEAAQQ